MPAGLDAFRVAEKDWSESRARVTGATSGLRRARAHGRADDRPAVAAGHDVRGFDVDAGARARAGAAAVGSLAEAAAGAEVVVLMLATLRVVRQVVLDEGLLDALEPGVLVVDMGSSDPTQTRELAAEAARAGSATSTRRSRAGSSGRRRGR